MKPRHEREHTKYPSHQRESSEKIVHPTVDVAKVRDIDDVIGEHKEMLRQQFEISKNKSTLFIPGREARIDGNHNVTVNANINEAQEDCSTSCFSGLVKCFGK